MPKPNVKEQIVTAGLHLLHSKGFNATSVQDITQAAGVPKGSFYNHFASKEALGVEVLQLYSAAAVQARGFLLDTSLAPLERLRGYFGDLIEQNVAGEFCAGCMLGNFSTELASQSPLIREQTSLSFAALTGLLERIIDEGQRDGTIAGDQPAAQLANFASDAWQGAVLRAKVEKNRAPLDRFMAMMERLLTGV